MTKKKMLNKGLHTWRFGENGEEERFAQAWEDANRLGNTLDHLLDVRSVQGGRPPPSSERDRSVAATVVQWLGSEVGQAFLSDLGYARASSPRAKTVRTVRSRKAGAKRSRPGPTRSRT